MGNEDEFTEQHPPADVLTRIWEALPNRPQGFDDGVPEGGAGSKAIQSVNDQAAVLGRSLNIYIERNAKRTDAWREAGAKGQLVEMRKKLDRLWRTWHGNVNQKDIDEALDLINAACFWVRAVEADDHNGMWPWPD